SAARKTTSPGLSAEENARLFGLATSIHGHNYRVRLTYRSSKAFSPQDLQLVGHDAIHACLRALHEELDHRFLNQDVAGLANHPITTESLAHYIADRAYAMAPLDRVRLHDRADFFPETWKGRAVFRGKRRAFQAGPRLRAAA